MYRPTKRTARKRADSPRERFQNLPLPAVVEMLSTVETTRQLRTVRIETFDNAPIEAVVLVVANYVRIVASLDKAIPGVVNAVERSRGREGSGRRVMLPARSKAGKHQASANSNSLAALWARR